MITLTKNYDFSSQWETYAFSALLMSVYQALFACSANNRDPFDRQTVHERITEEVFGDRFYLKMHISWESVDDSFT